MPHQSGPALSGQTQSRKVLWRALLTCLAVAALLQSCGGPSENNNNSNANTSTNQNNTNITAPARPEGCHPMAEGLAKGACMLPFPSSYYLVKDDTTGTGFRVSFPNGVLPVADHGDEKFPIKPDFYNQRDGFSPASPILALFDKRVDPGTLVGSGDGAKSAQSDSPVQLIEFGTHKRIPLFAEVDRSLLSDTAPQVVIVRPMVRLSPKTRYAVVFLRSVKAAGGGELTAPSAYQRLAAGEAPKTPAEAALAPLIKDTQAEIKAAGLDPSQVLLAWDFRTASDEPLLQEMVGMRDKMMAKVGDDGPTYTIKQVFNFTEDQKKNVMRIVQGRMKVPSFLDKDVPRGRLLRDDKGNPKIRGLGEFRFQVHIPRCVKDRKGPVPILVFGHGLFGSASGEMDSDYQRQLINRLCMVQIGNDWIGLSEADAGPVAVNVLTDFNNMPEITHRLQQAHINTVAMTRMALRRLIKEKALEVDGRSPIDGKEIYYLGISNGAIQGGMMMALNPDIQRGILNVGGANWSMMISRSANFAALATMQRTFYPDPVERQLILSLIQMHFDIVDPYTYAPYVLAEPKRFGVPPKKLLIQEGIGDAQVPNIATRMWVRTMKLSAVGPLFESVFGIEEKTAPLNGSAYIQYGPRPDPYPENANVPAKSNSTHEAVRRVEAAMKQMEAFFKPDGTIQQFCEGSCDPE